MELEHEGKFTLAVGCSNTEEFYEGHAEHRIFLRPDKPIIRKLFKKIDVRSDLGKLTTTLRELLEDSPLNDGVSIDGLT